MNKHILRLLFVIPILVFFFYNHSYSKDNFAPPVQTGANGEPSCGFSNSTNTCHGRTNMAGQHVSELLSLNTDITLLADGDEVTSTFKYVPDKVYLMTFRIENPAQRGGFSITAIRNNIGNQAGSFSIPTGSDAEITDTLTTYVGHTNSLGVSEWTFNWAAPAQQSGDVTFFASANKGNDNDNTSGDKIIPFKMEISENTTVGISHINIKNEVSIKNNPLLNNTLSFDVYVKEPKQYFITAYDLSGKLILNKHVTFHGGLKEFNHVIDQKGIFILNIRTNKNESASFKIFN